MIALHNPGEPVRVRWRREDEFGFEPVSPAMVTTVRAVLDGDGRPADWTTEIWSGRHSSRPGGGGNLLAAEALPDPPPAPPAQDPPEANGGGGTRNGEPLYDFAQKRIVHHLVAETPVRTSSLRGLGATINVFAIESFMDELAGGLASTRWPIASRYSRMPAPGPSSSGSREMAGWRSGAAGRQRQGPRHRLRPVQKPRRLLRRGRRCRGRRERAGDECVVRLRRGADRQPRRRDQPARRRHRQGASWGLKEGVRLDSAGIASRDWETYPILRFTEMPEIAVELVDPLSTARRSASARPPAGRPSRRSATPSRRRSAPASATCR